MTVPFRHWLVKALPLRQALPAVVVGVLAGVWGWMGTSAGLGLNINWDAGNYVSSIAQGHYDISSLPWNSHLAVGHVYLIGSQIAAVFGATVIDGIRLMNAAALAGATLCLAICCARLARSSLLGALLSLLFVSCFGIVALIFTLEDNVLFFPFVALALTLAYLQPPGPWRSPASLVAGIAVGLGWLISWQVICVVLPVVYALVVPGIARSQLRARLFSLVLFIAGFLVPALVWLVVVAAAGDLSFAELVDVAGSRPQPSFFPKTAAEALALFGRHEEIFHHLGLGVVQMAGPLAALPPTPELVNLGQITAPIVVVLLVAGIVGCVVVRKKDEPLRDGARAVHLTTVSLFSFVAAGALYLDVVWDKYKRFDLAVMSLVALAASLIGFVVSRSRRRHLVVACLATLLSGSVLWQAKVALSHVTTFHDNMDTHQPPNKWGFGGKTWFGFARSLKRSHPEACLYVFTLDELAHARHQSEIVAALASELGKVVAVGNPAAVAGWRSPPPVMTAEVLRGQLRGCEWFTPAARNVVPPPN